jgi:hypothetical protein
MKSKWILMAMVLVLVAPFALVTASAQVATGEANEATPEERDSPPLAEEVDAKAIWRQPVNCSLGRPSDVQGYDVRCTNASFLDARIADCCIAGDHFQVKVKNWDRAPNTAVTTSPGPAGAFGVPARVYNYGGTPQNPRNLHAYVECTYLHGVDIFGAGSTIDLSSDGNCVVTPDPRRSRIDRSP